MNIKDVWSIYEMWTIRTNENQNNLYNCWLTLPPRYGTLPTTTRDIIIMTRGGGVSIEGVPKELWKFLAQDSLQVRLLNNLYCVEWDVKPYYTIPLQAGCPSNLLTSSVKGLKQHMRCCVDMISTIIKVFANTVMRTCASYRSPTHALCVWIHINGVLSAVYCGL